MTGIKDKMQAFTDKVNRRLGDTPANLPAISPNCNILGLEHETDNFLAEYNRVINSTDLPKIDYDNPSNLSE